MSLFLRYFGLYSLLGVIIILADAGTVFAGWLGFRNDTKATIVIQETVVSGGQVRPSRPQRLFAGEAVRDTPSPGCLRRLSVFDPANLNHPIYANNLPCPAANENVLYCIKPDGKGGITLEAVRSPAASPAPKR